MPVRGIVLWLDEKLARPLKTSSAIHSRGQVIFEQISSRDLEMPERITGQRPGPAVSHRGHAMGEQGRRTEVHSPALSAYAPAN